MNTINTVSFDTPFALIAQGDNISLYLGQIQVVAKITDLANHSISIIPFEQIKENGYMAYEDNLSINMLVPTTVTNYTRSKYIDMLPQEDFVIDTIQKNISDTEYAQLVEKVIHDEISKGTCANINISRIYEMKIDNFNEKIVLSIYRSLLISEPNAPMTFCFYDGEKYFVGASPEEHLYIHDGIATMNPISGTLSKSCADKLTFFLQDTKEISELYQVVDEECKMMAKMVTDVQLTGPYIKDMNSVLHTEYYIHGKLCVSPLKALQTSMFAATLIGSPLQSACEIIKRYEAESRRYYGGMIVVKKGNEIDSSIIIRTIEIDKIGNVRFQVGASIVQDSHPVGEAQETNAKAAGFINLLQGQTNTFVATLITKKHLTLLRCRNDTLSDYYFGTTNITPLLSCKVLLMYNGDDFIFVLMRILESLGCNASIAQATEIHKDATDYDIIVIGPGPGDPRMMYETQKIVSTIIKNRKQGGYGVMGICLGHQLIAHSLGYKLIQHDQCSQGMVLAITIDGVVYNMGYYNSFGVQNIVPSGCQNNMHILGSRGSIDFIRGDDLVTMQFHPESLYSTHGKTFLYAELLHLLS